MARVLRPRLTDFYPAVRQAAAVREVVRRLRPDVLVAYPVTAVAGMHGLTDVPRLAMVGDLDHVVPAYRWRVTPFRPFGRFVAATLRVVAARRQFDFMREVLSPCESVGCVVAHHASWLRANGVGQCVYLPMPTVDMAGPDWELRRQSYSPSRPRILMIGSLRGVSTLPGLHLFAREILPTLEDRLGAEAFEVHIVGRHEPPRELAKALARPAVRLRGFVEDVSKAFFSADVLLVPTPTELGTRTRMIMGASYGCCMVAHSANALGTPEFSDGRDVLLGRTGSHLADLVVRVLADADLRRRLGHEARATYERHFTVETAGRRLSEELEIAASRWSRASAR